MIPITVKKQNIKLWTHRVVVQKLSPTANGLPTVEARYCGQHEKPGAEIIALLKS